MSMNAKQRCVANPILSDLYADDVEQAIVRALVQLGFQDEKTNNSRPIVMRLGPLNVRLSETPPEYATAGLPPFWIEIFDGASQGSIDSIGFHELDDTELAAAVEMIICAAGSR